MKSDSSEARSRDSRAAKDALLVVDVFQELVQRCCTLDQASFDHAPLGLRDHARDQVEGKDPLDALVVAVDGETDPLVSERGVDRGAPLVELRRRQRREQIVQRLIVRARLAGSPEHLVEEAARVVPVHQAGAGGIFEL